MFETRSSGAQGGLKLNFVSENDLKLLSSCLRLLKARMTGDTVGGNSAHGFVRAGQALHQLSFSKEATQCKGKSAPQGRGAVGVSVARSARACAALAEDLPWVARICNSSNSSSRTVQCFWPPRTPAVTCARKRARAHTHFKNNKKKNKSLKEERAAEKWERCALILVSVVTSLGASV